MIIFLQEKKAEISFKGLCLALAIIFVFSTFTLYISRPNSYASALGYMPPPTKLIAATADFFPVAIKGLKFYSDDPFRLDFILDEGDTKYSDQELKVETQRLIEYFLTALTIPEEDLWVNLSPYEKNRIIPDELGRTLMGRDMLGEDYVLKQLSSSLTYPESRLGKEFWGKVYEKANQLYGVTDIPTDIFHKVWIMPKTAVVYEKEDGAFLGETKLKVMMEADYFAAQKQNSPREGTVPIFSAKKMGQSPNDISSQIAKEVILPIIENEVNHGKQFTHLRQIYDSLILATWFKKKLRKTFYDAIYLDKKKIKGVEGDDPQIKDKIYAQYVEAYKKGVYNYIKHEYDLSSQSKVNRRYYSGGVLNTRVSTVIDEKPAGDKKPVTAGSATVFRTQKEVLSSSATGQTKLDSSKFVRATNAVTIFLVNDFERYKEYVPVGNAGTSMHTVAKAISRLEQQSTVQVPLKSSPTGIELDLHLYLQELKGETVLEVSVIGPEKGEIFYRSILTVGIGRHVTAEYPDGESSVTQHGQSRSEKFDIDSPKGSAADFLYTARDDEELSGKLLSEDGIAPREIDSEEYRPYSKTTVVYREIRNLVNLGILVRLGKITGKRGATEMDIPVAFNSKIRAMSPDARDTFIDRVTELPQMYMGDLSDLSAKDFRKLQTTVEMFYPNESTALSCPGTEWSGLTRGEFMGVIRSKEPSQKVNFDVLKNVMETNNVPFANLASKENIDIYFGEIPGAHGADARIIRKGDKNKLAIIINDRYINGDNFNRNYFGLAEILTHELRQHAINLGSVDQRAKHRQGAADQKNYFSDHETKLTPYHRWAIRHMTDRQLETLVAEYIRHRDGQEKRRKEWGNYENLFFNKAIAELRIARVLRKNNQLLAQVRGELQRLVEKDLNDRYNHVNSQTGAQTSGIRIVTPERHPESYIKKGLTGLLFGEIDEFFIYTDSHLEGVWRNEPRARQLILKGENIIVDRTALVNVLPVVAKFSLGQYFAEREIRSPNGSPADLFYFFYRLDDVGDIGLIDLIKMVNEARRKEKKAPLAYDTIITDVNRLEAGGLLSVRVDGNDFSLTKTFPDLTDGQIREFNSDLNNIKERRDRPRIVDVQTAAMTTAKRHHLGDELKAYQKPYKKTNRAIAKFNWENVRTAQAIANNANVIADCVMITLSRKVPNSREFHSLMRVLNDPKVAKEESMRMSELIRSQAPDVMRGETIMLWLLDSDERFIIPLEVRAQVLPDRSTILEIKGVEQGIELQPEIIFTERIEFLNSSGKPVIGRQSANDYRLPGMVPIQIGEGVTDARVAGESWEQLRLDEFAPFDLGSHTSPQPSDVDYTTRSLRPIKSPVVKRAKPQRVEKRVKKSNESLESASADFFGSTLKLPGSRGFMLSDDDFARATAGPANLGVDFKELREALILQGFENPERINNKTVEIYPSFLIPSLHGAYSRIGSYHGRTGEKLFVIVNSEYVWLKGIAYQEDDYAFLANAVAHEQLDDGSALSHRSASREFRPREFYKRALEKMLPEDLDRIVEEYNRLGERGRAERGWNTDDTYLYREAKQRLENIEDPRYGLFRKHSEKIAEAINQKLRDETEYGFDHESYRSLVMMVASLARTREGECAVNDGHLNDWAYQWYLENSRVNFRRTFDARGKMIVVVNYEIGVKGGKDSQIENKNLAGEFIIELDDAVRGIDGSDLCADSWGSTRLVEENSFILQTLGAVRDRGLAQEARLAACWQLIPFVGDNFGAKEALTHSLTCLGWGDASKGVIAIADELISAYRNDPSKIIGPLAAILSNYAIYTRNKNDSLYEGVYNLNQKERMDREKMRILKFLALSGELVNARLWYLMNWGSGQVIGGMPGEETRALNTARIAERFGSIAENIVTDGKKVWLVSGSGIIENIEDDGTLTMVSRIDVAPDGSSTDYSTRSLKPIRDAGVKRVGPGKTAKYGIKGEAQESTTFTTIKKAPRYTAEHKPKKPKRKKKKKKNKNPGALRIAEEKLPANLPEEDVLSALDVDVTDDHVVARRFNEQEKKTITTVFDLLYCENFLGDEMDADAVRDELREFLGDDSAEVIGMASSNEEDVMHISLSSEQKFRLVEIFAGTPMNFTGSRYDEGVFSILEPILGSEVGKAYDASTDGDVISFLYGYFQKQINEEKKKREESTVVKRAKPQKVEKRVEKNVDQQSVGAIVNAIKRSKYVAGEYIHHEEFTEVLGSLDTESIKNKKLRSLINEKIKVYIREMKNFALGNVDGTLRGFMVNMRFDALVENIQGIHERYVERSVVKRAKLRKSKKKNDSVGAIVNAIKRSKYVAGEYIHHEEFTEVLGSLDTESIKNKKLRSLINEKIKVYIREMKSFALGNADGTLRGFMVNMRFDALVENIQGIHERYVERSVVKRAKPQKVEKRVKKDSPKKRKKNRQDFLDEKLKDFLSGEVSKPNAVYRYNDFVGAISNSLLKDWHLLPVIISKISSSNDERVVFPLGEAVLIAFEENDSFLLNDKQFDTIYSAWRENGHHVSSAEPYPRFIEGGVDRIYDGRGGSRVTYDSLFKLAKLAVLRNKGRVTLLKEDLKSPHTAIFLSSLMDTDRTIRLNESDLDVLFQRFEDLLAQQESEEISGVVSILHQALRDDRYLEITDYNYEIISDLSKRFPKDIEIRNMLGFALARDESRFWQIFNALNDGMLREIATRRDRGVDDTVITYLHAIWVALMGNAYVLNENQAEILYRGVAEFNTREEYYELRALSAKVLAWASIRSSNLVQYLYKGLFSSKFIGPGGSAYRGGEVHAYKVIEREEEREMKESDFGSPFKDPYDPKDPRTNVHFLRALAVVLQDYASLSIGYGKVEALLERLSRLRIDTAEARAIIMVLKMAMVTSGSDVTRQISEREDKVSNSLRNELRGMRLYYRKNLDDAVWRKEYAVLFKYKNGLGAVYSERPYAANPYATREDQGGTGVKRAKPQKVEKRVEETIDEKRGKAREKFRKAAEKSKSPLAKVLGKTLTALDSDGSKILESDQLQSLIITTHTSGSVNGNNQTWLADFMEVLAGDERKALLPVTRKLIALDSEEFSDNEKSVIVDVLERLFNQFNLCDSSELEDINIALRDLFNDESINIKFITLGSKKVKDMPEISLSSEKKSKLINALTDAVSPQSYDVEVFNVLEPIFGQGLSNAYNEALSGSTEYLGIFAFLWRHFDIEAEEKNMTAKGARSGRTAKYEAKGKAQKFTQKEKDTIVSVFRGLYDYNFLGGSLEAAYSAHLLSVLLKEDVEFKKVVFSEHSIELDLSLADKLEIIEILDESYAFDDIGEKKTCLFVLGILKPIFGQEVVDTYDALNENVTLVKFLWNHFNEEKKKREESPVVKRVKPPQRAEKRVSGVTKRLSQVEEDVVIGVIKKIDKFGFLDSMARMSMELELEKFLGRDDRIKLAIEVNSPKEVESQEEIGMSLKNKLDFIELLEEGVPIKDDTEAKIAIPLLKPIFGQGVVTAYKANRYPGDIFAFLREYCQEEAEASIVKRAKPGKIAKYEAKGKAQKFTQKEKDTIVDIFTRFVIQYDSLKASDVAMIESALHKLFDDTSIDIEHVPADFKVGDRPEIDLSLEKRFEIADVLTDYYQPIIFDSSILVLLKPIFGQGVIDAYNEPGASERMCAVSFIWEYFDVRVEEKNMTAKRAKSQKVEKRVKKDVGLQGDSVGAIINAIERSKYVAGEYVHHGKFTRVLSSLDIESIEDEGLRSLINEKIQTSIREMRSFALGHSGGALEGSVVNRDFNFLAENIQGIHKRYTERPVAKRTKPQRVEKRIIGKPRDGGITYDDIGQIVEVANEGIYNIKIEDLGFNANDVEGVAANFVSMQRNLADPNKVFGRTDPDAKLALETKGELPYAQKPKKKPTYNLVELFVRRKS